MTTSSTTRLTDLALEKSNEVLPTPRIWKAEPLVGSYCTPGTRYCRSVTDWKFELSSALLLTELIEIGTAWALSTRRWAVTTIVSSVLASDAEAAAPSAAYACANDARQAPAERSRLRRARLTENMAEFPQSQVDWRRTSTQP